ncbi:MAG: fasciclin domain-containing protein, partial [Saprospiraceae bacterium]|nr:fasciclin domain-containing protein [Saprospiraceae bacterium]
DDLAAALGTDIAGLLALPNLADVLLYHVLGATVPSSAVSNGLIAQPLSSTNTLKFTVTSASDVFVNQAPITGFDITAANGVVHILDAVVLPVETVVDIAIDNGFTSLTAAVATAELLPALTNPLAQFTVFAPTDAAFDDLAAALGTDIAGLLALPNLADVLLYHVLGATVPSSAVTNGLITQPLSTTNTLKFTVTSTSDVFVNQAPITGFDITADNGVVHVLDAVVLPVETVVDIAIDNGFTSLTTAVVTAELLPALTDPLAEFTVFAPTDAAFDDLAAALGTDIAGLLALPNLADVLLYHVLGAEVPSSAVSNGLIAQPLSTTNTLKFTVTSTSDVFVNQAPITGFDITADNGVVHVLDAVVLPVETVVDIAIDNGFTSLTTAVVTAELLPALTDPLAEFTVFAPTDEAFDNLAADLGTDIAGILALPNLADVLLYHVVAGTVLSTDLSNGTVTTLNGADVTVDITSGVMINNSNVTTPDVLADNGVVHIIDAVLVPGPVSTNAVIIENIALFPNPASNEIRFNTTSSVEFEVISVSGSIVKRGVSADGLVDISALQQGNYFIRFIEGEKISLGKFSKID